MSEIAPPGHNNPPEETPYEAIRVHIEDLYSETKNFCDGEPCENQGQADAAQSLMRQLQEAATLADKERKKENQPFDDGKAEVQARYNLLIGETKAVTGTVPRAVSALKEYLKPYLKKLEDDRQAEIKRQREEANRLAEEAAKAVQEAQGLEGSEQAEGAVRAAQDAAAEAKKLETTTAKASGGFGRASSLRDNWVPKLVDSQAAARHFWTLDPNAFDELLIKLAKTEIAAGKRTLPGFDVVNEPTVV